MSTAQTVSNAVATRDNGPGALVSRYSSDFATVLPSHVKPDTWVRLAQGVLRRDEKLLEVATKNPQSFLAALLECARLGHEPGTEEFYLVPFGNEVQGIEGYRGIVERIYRAGAVSSVVAEVVHERDAFTYRPGRDARPLHEIDWDAADRGPLRLAYAYAAMADGSTSKVVVVNRAYVDKVRKESRGSSRSDSPWQKWEEAMWLKTAARRLEPWVPTSTEYRREQLRAAAEATTSSISHSSRPVLEHVDTVTGEVLEQPAEQPQPHPFSQLDDSDRCEECGGYPDDPWHAGGTT